jgi:hypothetical protein
MFTRKRYPPQYESALIDIKESAASAGFRGRCNDRA